METTQPTETLSANPRTQAVHRRQVISQVLLPLALVVVLILILGVLTVIASQGNLAGLAQWRDTALIWIILPIISAGIIILLFLVAFIYLVAIILKKLPPYTHLVQLYIELFGARIRSIADRSTKPVVAAAMLSARITKIKELLTQRK